MTIRTLLASVVLVAAWVTVSGAQAAIRHTIDIPAQGLGPALAELARQTGVQLIYPAHLVAGINAQALSGSMTPAEALQRLLAQTKLDFDFLDAGTVTLSARTTDETRSQTTGPGSGRSSIVEAASQALLLAQTETPGETAARADEGDTDTAASQELPRPEESGKAIPEMLVRGSRSLNTDIERTEDDPQPYVVFTAEEIERSQAVNLEDFLRTRLPMNTASGSLGQSTGVSTNVSTFNLRGLGDNQTLILVDGRRMPGTSTTGLIPGQPDLNGIPLSAVERIEVLPSTAGGIYGGSATGGVINIVLRRDYHGVEARAIYGNTFGADAANVRLDASAGFSLGRTRFMLTASHSEGNTLKVGDRDFAARALELQRANNPNVFEWTTSSFIPPGGATVNIRSADGTPLVLDQAYGGQTLISDVTGQPTSITHLPLGYAGPGSDGGQALLRNAGRYNLDIPNDLLGLQRGLVAAPSMDSASLNVRRELGSRVEAFVDLTRLGSEGSSFSADVPTTVFFLPATAPNNPFQQAINVRFPTPGLSFESRSESVMVRATGGLIAQLPRQWMGGLDYAWSQSRYEGTDPGSVVDAAASTSLGTGLPPADGRPALNALQEGNTYPIDWTPYLLPLPNRFHGPYKTILRDATLRLSGPTVQLPGGALNLSMLAERRKEALQDGFFQGINTATRAPTYVFFPHRSQEVNSYYLEAVAPWVSAKNGKLLMKELELQVSVRRDEYETTTTATNSVFVPSRQAPFPALNYATGTQESTDYTVGLKYKPVEDITLRASFGTGFLPPSVRQIAPDIITSTTSLGRDPKRGLTQMNPVGGRQITIIQGGNPLLEPELSESWSAGVILTPRVVPGLRLSVDYTQIDKADEIQSPLAQFMLDNEDLFPGRIIRGPGLPGDPAGWAGLITSFDMSLINIAKTTVEAYDIQADYTLSTRWGEFHGYAVATWEPHYRNQLLARGTVVDSVGFATGPLEWRGNVGLNWERRALSIGWNAQYYDAQWVYGATSSATFRASRILSQGSAEIPRQVYHDLVAMYRFDEGSGSGLLRGIDISLGIQNVFDKSPPIVATSSASSGGYSRFGDPRMRRYSISLRKSFN